MHTIFDGHNDLLLRLWSGEKAGRDPLKEFESATGTAHIDLKKAAEGGLVGGFCAIYVPSGGLSFGRPDAKGHYSTPVASPLERAPSLETTMAQMDIACRLDRAGLLKICRSVDELETAIAAGTFAAIAHIEGAEGIGEDLSGLYTLYAAGLRSIGPVWSRNNVFGHGVPFAYPSSPDTGPGLTDAGRALVKACNEMGILIDLSHITEQGFWDVAKHSTAPLVATHSNVHAITPSARNLTDKQLGAIKETQGVVGLNYAVAFLREDGQERADTGIATMIRHIDHMVEQVGIDGVALGSDFDGAMIPAEIGSAAGLQKLVAGLQGAGYADAEINKICRENWFRVLRLTLR
ncbi:dipeptidase [Tianweitania sp. BSSL-BM11]|uniref:Dipeptidase n=1 Tax=Tianweitania aestuarii TaxID=2814886 RepID=A0ABS5RXE7_9HYPH|nr:dipeptidase [Tianweitania aestuarii]MBS9720976.1 dipeptidase [Tianweitania aestuarii]